MYVLFAALPIFISTMNKLSKYTPASKQVGGCGASIALLTTLFVCVCVCVCVLLSCFFFSSMRTHFRACVTRSNVKKVNNIVFDEEQGESRPASFTHSPSDFSPLAKAT